MSLPLILIIDDQFGRSLKDRRNLCLYFGLIDITGDDPSTEEIKNPVCNAIFSSGQKIENGRVTNDIKTVFSSLKTGWPNSEGVFWSLVLLDIRFVSGKIGNSGEPHGQIGDTDFGLLILSEIIKFSADVPVVMLSSRERHEVIEECRKLGACDFIQRQTNEKTSFQDILRTKILEHGLIEDLRQGIDEEFRIIGKSLTMLKTLRSARRAATGKGNILILGETGTGKELLGKYIHDVSPKKRGPYQIFHPFGTAETLQEDELFGHIKGAFSGATREMSGLFESAHKGTLFIDEIGDIPERLQAKLLRPLETRIITRQGSNRQISLDFQGILATNKNLEEYAKTQRFKFDLLNRINSFSITLPPLKDRPEDIPLLAEKLVKDLCRKHEARWPRKILPETMNVLKKHHWPDNVRGLKNVLERAIKANKDSELIVPSDIDVGVEEKKTHIHPISKEENSPVSDLEKFLIEFDFPREYSKISGKFPALRKAIGNLLANYLIAALEITRKRKPEANGNGDLNITGAASCMIGKQLKTPNAADLVKKIMQFDEEVLNEFLLSNSTLKEAYGESLRLRPKGRKKHGN